MLGNKLLNFAELLSIEVKGVGGAVNLLSLNSINSRYGTRTNSVSNLPSQYDGFGDFTINGVRANRKDYAVSQVEVRQLNSSNKVFRWNYQQVQDQYYDQSGTIVYIPLNGLSIYAFDQLLSVTWFFIDSANQYNGGSFIPFVCNDVFLSQGGSNFATGFNYSRYNYQSQYFYIKITNGANSINFPNGMGAHISITYLPY